MDTLNDEVMNDSENDESWVSELMKSDELSDDDESFFNEVMNKGSELSDKIAQEKISAMKDLSISEHLALYFLFCFSSIRPSIEINDSMTARMVLLVRESEKRIMERIAEMEERIMNKN
ncbi:hypothetical protein A6M27_10760 [Acidithiobacillus thiooxidans]|uniref:Uncharacterized protein n=1 Tax=Acidithiobacillus thiooxidans TaxID=930 RepID=A0A1C2I784_ACITH|nr:hypothetical protein [Acidithiobacillus thiooxidans]OCX68706.1 hypothetical protein A6O24_19455 [Acidithiobacillus thiooxidans]OCX71828.1 hypothetical protein A6P07_11205 [Acidithiobacillus thiooxidans]OCX76812.1 hypothetical protein A6O26_20735 [Acidithiobacillus thiooxidans]OCX87156.1 hypothetical protein A6M27_10760 [Acidithiobacillus thiooxidans]OFC49619.1 hypothetical protein BAE47_04660 [Acidithiobacillus thiooxidans]